MRREVPPGRKGVRGSLLHQPERNQEDVRGVQRNPVSAGEFEGGVFGEGCLDAPQVQGGAVGSPGGQSSPSEALHPRPIHRRGGGGGGAARQRPAQAAAAGDTPLPRPHLPLHSLRRSALPAVLHMPRQPEAPTLRH